MGKTMALRISLVLLLALVAPQASASGGVPEVTHDGLHLQKHTKLARVWMKPGANLAGYDKLQILGCYVAFKKNWQRERDFSRHISAERMDTIKKELAQEFLKVFTEELAKLKPDVKIAKQLWPRFGETNLTSYITAALAEKPDAIMP